MYKSNRFQMKILETKRCILRPVSLKDASDLFDYYKHDIVVKYLPFKKHETISDTEKFIRSFFLKKYNEGKIGHYAIVSKKENKVIGNVGFNNISKSSKKGEIGICINPSYWGDDLSTELTEEILRHGFDDLNLEKITAITFEDNTYSQKSLENLGFRYVKTFNKNLKSKKVGNSIKCHEYEILKINYINKFKPYKKGWSP